MMTKRMIRRVQYLLNLLPRSQSDRYLRVLYRLLTLQAYLERRRERMNAHV